MNPYISEEQLDDMLHALGKSQTPDRSKMGWRNYYSTNERHEGWEDLMAKGLAERVSDFNFPPIVYRVSKQGLALLGVTLK